MGGHTYLIIQSIVAGAIWAVYTINDNPTRTSYDISFNRG